MKFSYTSVYFATFSRYEKGTRMPTNGMVEPILTYFLPKVESLVMLDLPHLVSDTIDPIVEVYEKCKIVDRYTISRLLYYPIYMLCKLPSQKPTRISYKLRDFFSVLYVGFCQKKNLDLFIGLESINALAGLILKKLGKVKTVVYYVSDYAPVRFENKLYNFLYVWLDRICVTHADFTWDVSPAMQKARLRAGLRADRIYRVIHVPNGLFPSQIQSIPISLRHKYSLVYMGILQLDMGPDLAIRAFDRVIQAYPKATLHIIGGPDKDTIYYKKLVKELRLEKSVTFYGYIQNNTDMAKIVRSCYVGLAPYRAFPDSLRWYGDAGKIRQYTASGLPVVTTNVPPFGHYIVEKGAGLMTADSVKDFSDGILKIFKDISLYKSLSSAATRVSKNNTWENVYTKALECMKYTGGRV